MRQKVSTDDTHTKPWMINNIFVFPFSFSSHTSSSLPICHQLQPKTLKMKPYTIVIPKETEQHFLLFLLDLFEEETQVQVWCFMLSYYVELLPEECSRITTWPKASELLRMVLLLYVWECMSDGTWTRWMLHHFCASNTWSSFWPWKWFCVVSVSSGSSRLRWAFLPHKHSPRFSVELDLSVCLDLVSLFCCQGCRIGSEKTLLVVCLGPGLWYGQKLI